MPGDHLPLNTGTSPDPLKNHKATKPAFNVGPLSVCQWNAGVSLASNRKLSDLSWTPSDKTFWLCAWICLRVQCTSIRHINAGFCMYSDLLICNEARHLVCSYSIRHAFSLGVPTMGLWSAAPSGKASGLLIFHQTCLLVGGPYRAFVKCSSTRQGILSVNIPLDMPSGRGPYHWFITCSSFRQGIWSFNIQ